MIKSNSVPNFLFEKPNSNIQRRLTLSLKPKIVSYGEFIRNNKNATKNERINAIKHFYDMLFKLS